MKTITQLKADVRGTRSQSYSNGSGTARRRAIFGSNWKGTPHHGVAAVTTVSAACASRLAAGAEYWPALPEN